jgi:hypothetical protein
VYIAVKKPLKIFVCPKEPRALPLNFFHANGYYFCTGRRNRYLIIWERFTKVKSRKSQRHAIKRGSSVEFFLTVTEKLYLRPTILRKPISIMFHDSFKIRCDKGRGKPLKAFLNNEVKITHLPYFIKISESTCKSDSQNR